MGKPCSYDTVKLRMSTYTHSFVGLLCTGYISTRLLGFLGHSSNAFRVCLGYGNATLVTDTSAKLKLTRSMVCYDHSPHHYPAVSDISYKDLLFERVRIR